MLSIFFCILSNFDIISFFCSKNLSLAFRSSIYPALTFGAKWPAKIGQKRNIIKTVDIFFIMMTSIKLAESIF